MLSLNHVVWCIKLENRLALRGCISCEMCAEQIRQTQRNTTKRKLSPVLQLLTYWGQQLVNCLWSYALSLPCDTLSAALSSRQTNSLVSHVSPQLNNAYINKRHALNVMFNCNVTGEIHQTDIKRNLANFIWPMTEVSTILNVFSILLCHATINDVNHVTSQRSRARHVTWT